MPLSETPDLANQYTTDESTFLKYQREARDEAELLSMQEEVNAMSERWSYISTSFPGSDGKTYVYLGSEPSLEDMGTYQWNGEAGWYEDDGSGKFTYSENQDAAYNMQSEYNALRTPSPVLEKTTQNQNPAERGSKVLGGTDKEKIPGYDQNYTGLFGKMELGPFVGNMYEGLSWGLGLMTAIKTLTDAGLIKKEYGEPLNKAAFAGIMAYKATYGAIEQLRQTDWYKNLPEGSTTRWIGRNSQTISSVVGLAVTYYVFADNYKKTKTKEATVEFKCYPWQAPNGGADCGKCNEDEQMPCSEYRCKALGQTCKLLNAGTDEAKCIDASPYDVTSPGIKPWPEVLTAGLSYDNILPRPPGGGVPGHMTVNGDGVGGCIKAFTPFEFGIITTDEGDVTQPAQCKIDFNHTADFDSMAYFMDNNNLYTEKHSQAFSLPGTDLLNKLYTDSNYSFAIKNDGKYSLYIRCKDGNGNTNEDEFLVNFCIDPTPDSEAPLIKATSVASGSGVRYKQDNVSIDVYTNEPANCRWSRRDASYINMENNMSCSNQVWQMNADLLYTCSAMLTGVKDHEPNTFYFKCEDINEPPNTMQQSYVFTLKGSQPLTMTSVGPNGTQSSATSTATVNLTAKTDNGLDNGKANCYFSTTGEETSYTMFYSTGTYMHAQPLDLTGGSYTYYIKCVDMAGNAVYNSTSFTVYIDKDEPRVLRAYSMENQLKIITNEESNCRYSTDNCNFDLSKTEGTLMPYENSKEHLAPFATDKTYYIKCTDKHGNSPQPSVCSYIAKPYSITFAEKL
jgi:hypothetical protein